MAVNKTDRYDWQKATKRDFVRYRKASPNLREGMSWLIKKFGGVNVGIYSRRPVRGGTVPSSHSFGAAMDWRYTNRRAGQAAMKLLVNHSKEFGVQMIVDYVGCVIWTPQRGWKKMEPNAKTGKGEAWAKWLHVETTKTAWSTKTAWDDRY